MKEKKKKVSTQIEARPFHSYFKSPPPAQPPSVGVSLPPYLGAALAALRAWATPPGAGVRRSSRGSPGGRAHRRPSRWLHTPPLPPAAPCRATMNLSGRAFVTESRCRLGSAAPLRPAVLQPLAARRCWSRFSELPVVRGSSPAFPRAPFLSFASTLFLQMFCNPCLLHSAGFLRPPCRVLPFLLFSVLPGVVMISPRSCPSARYPVGPQHSALCAPFLPLSRNSCQAISISKVVPDGLLAYSPTALRF